MTLSSNNSEPRYVWLFDFLSSIELQQYYNAFVSKLQVTELDHFDFVNSSDLKKIGLSSPAILRVSEALKVYRITFGLPDSLSPLYVYKRKGTGLNKLIGRPSSQNLGKSAFYYPQPAPTFKSSLSTSSSPKKEPEQKIPEAALLIPSTDVKLYDSLGYGSFGIVKRGDWKLPSGKWLPVAVKVLKPMLQNSSELFETFLHELQAMHSLHHPNLIRLYGLLLASPLMIVTELAPLGSLLAHLRAHSLLNEQKGESQMKLSFTADALWDIGVQLSKGMAYLASRNIVHRDLAARNVLLARVSPGEYPLVKIGDFGLARGILQQMNQLQTSDEQSSTQDFDQLHNSNYYKSNDANQLVPIAWTALEALENHRFSQASDVWSWAVTLWEIWTGGAEPWKGFSMDKLIEQLKADRRLAYPSRACPESIYQFMLASWQPDPGDRPSFAYLARRLSEIRPLVVTALHSLDQSDRLGIERGDLIVVLETSLQDCLGQNKRTGEIGRFPSRIVDLPSSNHLNLNAQSRQSQSARPLGKFSSQYSIFNSESVPVGNLLGDESLAFYNRSTSNAVSQSNNCNDTMADQVDWREVSGEFSELNRSSDPESTVRRQREFLQRIGHHDKPNAFQPMQNFTQNSSNTSPVVYMAASNATAAVAAARLIQSDNSAMSLPPPNRRLSNGITATDLNKISSTMSASCIVKPSEEPLIDFDTEISPTRPPQQQQFMGINRNNPFFDYLISPTPSAPTSFPTPSAPIYEFSPAANWFNGNNRI